MARRKKRKKKLSGGMIVALAILTSVLSTLFVLFLHQILKEQFPSAWYGFFITGGLLVILAIVMGVRFVSGKVQKRL